MGLWWRCADRSITRGTEGEKRYSCPPPDRQTRTQHLAVSGFFGSWHGGEDHCSWEEGGLIEGPPESRRSHREGPSRPTTADQQSRQRVCTDSAGALASILRQDER